MKFVASVPATSANLGPGFDSLGLALDLWNHFELRLSTTDRSITVETNGEGASTLPGDHTHLAAEILLDEIRRLAKIEGIRLSIPPLHLVCHNHVPAGSGLGSSSTAVLGGLMLAHAFVQWASKRTGELDQQVILQQAAAHEGHGDNVAPAMLGGLVIVAADAAGLIYRKVKIAPLRAVVCVPDFHFLTSQARSVLPQQIERADAIANIGRTSLVVEALRTGDYPLLASAMSDRLHEPFRLPIIPGALAARQAALAADAATVSLSGAGPGMIAFAETNHQAIGKAMTEAFAAAALPARFWILDSIDHGARLEILQSHEDQVN